MIGDDHQDVAAGARALAAGGLVAFPTETVYGLGADALDPQAVAAIFRAKGRPRNHPLICHIASADQLDDLVAAVPEAARALAERFWPGPLTLILTRSSRVPDAVTGGRDTVAVRIPGHPMALALLRTFGGPVAAPSANRFGRPSPTCAADVRLELGESVRVVLDGGRCEIGLESTVLDLTTDPPQILRPGAITAAAIAEVLGSVVRETATGPARAPGMLKAHYSPGARVEVHTEGGVIHRARELADAGTRIALIAPTAVSPLPPGTLVLGPAGDSDAYAAMLYAAFRRADAAGCAVILAVPPAPEGIGVAVRDRLRHAAAG